MNLSILLLLFPIDLIGFMIKINKNKRFANYHLRNLPFIWVFYS